ncbi:MAG: GatB/YqeY domain-containing protein, partial [Bdellovibrionales bacterium]|nr:GatB/YqeY domain-containing protein [Bdellovibrionales bacterium]
MSLKAKILSDMKEAMKAKDSKRLEVLRFLQSAIKNKEIELRPNAISETDILSVLTKQVKQRKESIDQFMKAERK